MRLWNKKTIKASNDIFYRKCNLYHTKFKKHSWCVLSNCCGINCSSISSTHFNRSSSGFYILLSCVALSLYLCIYLCLIICNLYERLMTCVRITTRVDIKNKININSITFIFLIYIDQISVSILVVLDLHLLHPMLISIDSTFYVYSILSFLHNINDPTLYLIMSLILFSKWLLAIIISQSIQFLIVESFMS